MSTRSLQNYPPHPSSPSASSLGSHRSHRSLPVDHSFSQRRNFKRPSALDPRTIAAPPLAERSVRYRGEFSNFQEYVFHSITEICAGALAAFRALWMQVKIMSTGLFHYCFSTEESIEEVEEIPPPLQHSRPRDTFLERGFSEQSYLSEQREFSEQRFSPRCDEQERKFDAMGVPLAERDDGPVIIEED